MNEVTAGEEPDDGGFDDAAVLSPEQLAELLAGMPDLGDPELPDLSEPDRAPVPAAPAMIGFTDGPAAAVPAISAPASPVRRTVRADRSRPPHPAPAVLDPEAASSLSWLFR